MIGWLTKEGRRLAKRSSQESPESVYFFTLHKCASSLFGDLVLKSFRGLDHVDYAGRIYSGEEIGDLVFEHRGKVYGPIRLSTARNSPVYEKLVGPTTERRFLRDKVCLLLVRDPRDILVSTYFSFGFSHGESANATIRAQQAAVKKRIQNDESLDAFVLGSARAVVRQFDRVQRVSEFSPRSAVLRYEDLINDFDRFMDQLTALVPVEDDAVPVIFSRSRPRSAEDVQSHHRSGRTEGFREKLQPETIGKLNETFGPVLGRFGYAP